MRATDWKFDFSSLPRWGKRNSIPWVYDEFYEILQSNTLCCIYSIRETTMMNYLGFLAILKNKEKPELFFNITDGISFCPNFFTNTEGNLIFLQPSIYKMQNNSVKRPILIIDISKCIFSYIVTDNTNPCYKIVELDNNAFKIEADAYQIKSDKHLNELNGKIITINHLEWYNLSNLESLPEMI